MRPQGTLITPGSERAKGMKMCLVLLTPLNIETAKIHLITDLQYHTTAIDPIGFLSVDVLFLVSLCLIHLFL